MKKFLCLLFAAALTMLPCTTRVLPARAATTYALIIADDAYLYREPTQDTSFDNLYFLLPKTYFVMVVQQNVTPSLHKVRYRDVVGYIASSQVEIKDYVPKSIYPDTVTLKVNIDSPSVYVRSRPDHLSENIVYALPKDSKNIEYYNRTTGTVAGSTDNASWYYIKVTLDGDSVIKGYIYSAYVLLESSIPAENDTTAVIPPQTGNPPSPTDPKLDVTDEKVRMIGIGAVTLPALLLVFLIFRGTKRKSDRTVRETSRSTAHSADGFRMGK